MPQEMLKRLVSTLEVKAMDEDKREITGIASTPETDRMGDIVDPEGAEFKLPVPLLWQHDHRQPIGEVIAAKVTDKGIEITARLAKVDGPSQLAARLEEAWQSIKAGLVRGLSIGFSPIEYTVIDTGYRFVKWSWNELSAVTIPANASANIDTVKHLDREALAATGRKLADPLKGVQPAGDTAPTRRKGGPVILKKSPEDKTMDIQAQLDQFRAALAEKRKGMEKLMGKAADEGRSLDNDEAEQFDEMQAEIDTIKQHIVRLEKMVDADADTAKSVQDRSGMQARSPAPRSESEGVDDGHKGHQGHQFGAVARVREKLEPGVEFARYAMALGAAKGNLSDALAIAKSRFPHTERVINTLKAAVSAGTTTDASWAGNLVEYNQFAGDFVEYLRPRTIVGRFGMEGIPALRSIPFNVHIRGQNTGATAGWVGQGAPKPITNAGYTDTNLTWAKIAAIAVLTEELMRFSNPSAERLVRDELASAVIEVMDTDFVDPDVAAVANVSPASISNGVTPIASSGVDADAVRADVAAAMQGFIAANITPAAGVWIMSATTALNLSLMRNALGQKEFPDLTMTGGTFEGLPVIVSEYVPVSSSGHYVLLVNASDVWLADDGVVTLDASREASLQMDSAPTNNSGTPAATQLVSMFQTNSVALRAERYVNWQKRRAAACQVIKDVNWGE